jgi:uncharacterized repeat protein (TIGR01451 family)
VDPSNSANLYAGTFAGLFKSTNGGATWNPSGFGLTTLNIQQLRIDPNTPTTIYAATAGAGVFKSMDAGATWQPSGSSLVPLPAQLSVNLTHNPDPVTSGGSVLYTATVNNYGQTAANNVVVSFPLPAGMSLISCSTPLGSCSANNGTVTAALGTVAAGTNVLVQILVMAPAAAVAQSSVNATVTVSTTSTQVPQPGG